MKALRPETALCAARYRLAERFPATHTLWRPAPELGKRAKRTTAAGLGGGRDSVLRLSSTESPTEVHGAIDLGTNSFHMLIARVNAEGRLETLTREKEPVRLGSGSGDMSELAPEAIDRGIACLSRFQKIAQTYNADITAVATSAIREAHNREEFVTRAYDETGVAVQVISGVEEARLIYLGILQAVPVYKKQALTVDIGGGSTETLIGKGGQILFARSQKLGHIRLTDRFFSQGRIRKNSVKDCRTFIRSFLAPVSGELRDIGFDVAVGSSGTIAAIAKIIEHREGRDPKGRVNNASFTRADLEGAVEEIIGHSTTLKRTAIAGLDPARADVIVGGVLLLEQLFDAIGIESMAVSEYALREGVLLDQMQRGDDDSFHHLSDLRRDRVLRLARAYNEDLEHVLHSTDLSLEIFDGTRKLHQLGLVERDFLEAAGMLHNVGLFISHAAHHKHSYYVIRNSDQLVGFTEYELEIIAQVARYHRKSHPKSKHSEFMALRKGDQATVRALAGMLRIGIALDRTRTGAIGDVTVELGSKVTIYPLVTSDADVSLELYTARARLGLLSEALGRPVEISE